jgi:hypothetical protein
MVGQRKDRVHDGGKSIQDEVATFRSWTFEPELCGRRRDRRTQKTMKEPHVEAQSATPLVGLWPDLRVQYLD